MKTPGILKLYIRVLCDNGHDKGRHIGKLAFCHTQLKRTALDYVSGSGFCRNLDRRCMDRREMTGFPGLTGTPNWTRPCPQQAYRPGAVLKRTPGAGWPWFLLKRQRLPD